MSKINDVNSDSQQTTGFFTNVAAFTLPPETWNLVTGDYGKVDLKIMLCLLLASFEAGHQAEDLGFNDIVDLTGLSRSSVAVSVKSLKQNGLIIELERGYRVSLKNLGKLKKCR
ncbi:MAG: hypothetical protein KDI62_27895 [Anaerolineae bacterium]|nr:hypothetical protein [Anaerolineae bacterium]MCB9105848.1 hypothetical protein [Anaerolineales bacterium]